jgi:mannose-1-phosphate guanylyltransferase/mannose-1-phosphate guanylyltransferase/mannose-6-phosphate isomerase
MIPFVLSGGSGTRLWPVSRESYPKQFCELFDESLLAKTLRRLQPLAYASEAPGVIGSVASEALTRRVLRELGIPEDRSVFEPVARDTAPAVALLCHRMLQEDRGDEVAGVFPADHLVADEETFARAIRLAEHCARRGRVVTLGIRPSGPDTGYGYIESTNDAFAEETGPPAGREPLRALAVRGFREKPDADTAREYVASGEFFWNAGMFVFRVAVLAGHFERLMPELWGRIRRIRPDLSNLAEIYQQIAPESLDYGVMEHLHEQVTIPCDPGWSDVGSWDEVARLRASAPAVEVGGSGNFVFPHGERVYALVGVEDLLVVDTADALLVARRGSSQRVKEVVGELRAAGRREADEHAFEVRPWGRFEVLRDEEDFKSKVIRVDPGQRLSYQSHRHRAEHWVVVRGRPEVVLDDRALSLAPGEHVFIPRGARHRISNPGEEPVVFVEVQVGTYFGEDDILRYQDDYDRT